MSTTIEFLRGTQEHKLAAFRGETCIAILDRETMTIQFSNRYDAPILELQLFIQKLKEFKSQA